MEGWISLHRKILDNPVICKDSDYFSIWCYLLLSATHDNFDTLFNGKRITLTKGQLITGRKTISEKFNISESKVQRILKTFESEQQIEQQTGTRNRLITIVNWQLYQNNEQRIEQQVNNKRTTSEQQVNTYNNGNNENNVDNGINTIGKKSPKTQNDFEKLIQEYTTDGKLIEAINNYITHRRDMKKPIKSDNTLKLILTELDKHNDKIAVINQSIMNGWQGIFALKNNNGNNQKKESETTNLFKKLMEEGVFDE